MTEEGQWERRSLPSLLFIEAAGSVLSLERVSVEAPSLNPGSQSAALLIRFPHATIECP